MTQEELENARNQGRRDAEHLVGSSAPEAPILRLAWAVGVGQVDLVRAAIQDALDAGLSWREIGEAMGQNPNTVRSKYLYPDRSTKYRERKRGDT